MPTRGNPFDELDRLLDQMERNFDEAARWWERESADAGAASVQIDLEDRDDELVLTADLPGFDSDDIDVRVTDRSVSLSAEREATTEEESEGEYVRRERRRTAVSRSLSLPAAVDADAVEASYRNGVLRVRLPKREPGGEGRRIDVE
jgi:HSP20 family protein